MRRALADYWREHVLQKVADEGRQEDAIAHLNAFMGDDPLLSVDIPKSRLYVKARQQGLIGGGSRRKDKRGSLATIRRELTVLRAAANHERRWKRINALPSIELPAEERPDHDVEQPYFEKSVLAALFDAAQKQIDACRAEVAERPCAAAETALRHAIELRAWMRITYYVGARRRSVEDLLGSQVNLFRRQIVLATPGKTRTKKRQPIVPIFDEIVPDVAALVAENPMGRLFTCSSFYRPFMALCRSLDLPEPHHPHMLRHSRATHLLQDGKQIWDVAGLLGDTVVTVQNTYGHHSPNELRSKLA